MKTAFASIFNEQVETQHPMYLIRRWVAELLGVALKNLELMFELKSEAFRYLMHTV